jgi:soluble lytic murein transglycosylase-like protein
MPALRPNPRLAAALAFACLAARPVRAELVILTTGDILKVSAYSASAESATLSLAGGGSMRLPLQQIDRVIEDEVEEPVAAASEPIGAAALELRFVEGAAIPAGRFGGLAYWAAKKHALNPRLVAAVARAESAWNPRAVSRKGARGLMQLMPSTGQRFGVRRAELFDIEKNLDAGSRYLAWLVERFDGRLEHVLAAYNAGEGTVERYGGVPPYRETREYIRRIYGYLGLDAAAAATAGAAPPAGDGIASLPVVSSLR